MKLPITALTLTLVTAVASASSREPYIGPFKVFSKPVVISASPLLADYCGTFLDLLATLILPQ